MSELKKVVYKTMEVFAILAIGLLVTIYILKHIYESFGIQFLGNVWVNWFGISYILFVLFTLIAAWFLFKDSVIFKLRLQSVLFWFLFIGANYVVFIPFLKGENPF